MPHRLGLEGDRERAAVRAVLVEIKQHQPAREQAVEQGAPALFAGKDPVPVEQHKLVRLGPAQHHRPAAESSVAVNLAVAGDHVGGEGVRIGEHPEGVADDRRPAVARDMGDGRGVEPLAPVREWGGSMRGGGSEGGHHMLRCLPSCK